MSVPKYNELFTPVLSALRELGGTAHLDEIDDRVATNLGLSEADVTEPHTDGSSKYRYQLRWSRNYLKRAGFIRKEGSGVWSLTDQGKDADVIDEASIKRSVRRVDRKAHIPNEVENAVSSEDGEISSEDDSQVSPTSQVDDTQSGIAPLPIAPTISFLDAANQILSQCADKKPMHYRAIAQRALEQGLIRTSGKTPEATLYAQILTDIKRRSKRGEAPRFLQMGKGVVGLARWEEDQGPVAVIEHHNTTIRAKLRGRLAEMSPDEFETLVSQLLVAIGFENVVVTARSNDGGIDVRGTLVIADVIRIRMAVQAKKWKKNVQRPTVQQVRGSLGTHDQGLVITTSDFSSGAREEAARTDAVPVGLMNGDQLIVLLVEHNLGVRRTPHDVLELGTIELE